MKPITIAIDGYSATGKSTLARDLADALGFVFLDTGAMYRAVTLYLLDNGIDWHNPEQLEEALLSVSIAFRRESNGKTITLLNGRNVESEIRSMRVSDVVSEVAAISVVRRFLVVKQQQIGKEGGIIMDGRDIGTVVFPDAELKLFVTADFSVRTQRRLRELQTDGVELDEHSVAANLRKRDKEETEREDSPLMKPNDAITLDTTHHTRESQLKEALRLAEAITP